MKKQSSRLLTNLPNTQSITSYKIENRDGVAAIIKPILENCVDALKYILLCLGFGYSKEVLAINFTMLSSEKHVSIHIDTMAVLLITRVAGLVLDLFLPYGKGGEKVTYGKKS